MDSGGGVLLNFFITGQKHDRDRFELKFGLIPEKIVARQKWTYDVNILMLSPKNLGFLNSGLENGIEENFQSFLGLHVHAESLGKDRQKILQKYLKHLKDKPSESILSYTVLELESYLKALIRELKSSKKDEILDSWITRLNDLELSLIHI